MPEAEARNKFAGAPFAQGGIGCAACHGDAAEHVRTLGKATVANPAKMSAVRRDSVCLQCHLEGDAAVYRPGTSLAAFKPGDDLSDHVKYFVKASAEAGGGRASSQWEALLRSKCKQASGGFFCVHRGDARARRVDGGVGLGREDAKRPTMCRKLLDVEESEPVGRKQLVDHHE